MVISGTPAGESPQTTVHKTAATEPAFQAPKRRRRRRRRRIQWIMYCRGTQGAFE